MQWIYLDNNATTRPADEVADAVDQANRLWWANPSSVHRFGQTVRQRLELARQSVADLVGASPRELIFTSGGTEANNLALHGTLDGEDDAVLITTRLEHAAIREPTQAIEKQGAAVAWIDVDDDGVVNLAHFDELLEKYAGGGRAVLVSVQWANNETGVLQPIEDLASRIDAVRKRLRSEGERGRLYLHTDATQAVGKIPVDLAQVKADLLTFSAHKFHGPKGIGMLYVRRGVRLRAQQLGGPQERERRGGTEHVAGILGMGIAAQLAQQFIVDDARIETLRKLRDNFEANVTQHLPNVSINSGGAARLWNTSNLGFKGIEAEAILLGLSEKGVCASAGAACSSGSLEPSPVLLAMGLSEPVAHGSVRFSLSRQTTEEELDAAAQHVIAVVEKLGRTMPTG